MNRTWIAQPAHVARRTLPAMLLASTMLAGGGSAVAAEATAQAASSATTIGEVIVTASKRSENIQKVPMSIQAIDSKLISQYNITNFSDYSKLIPSLQYQSAGPDSAIIYMRGVADGGNGNHSGPQPSVGSYLDELPITTIGGTLDLHIYDIARIEALPGPQGTLYGASSESGTLRIITNKPSTAGFSGGVDVEGNWVDHGSEGYVVQGFVNIPLSDRLAVRLVAFDEHDAGYIDNVPGQRAFVECGALPTSSTCTGTPGPVDSIINNAAFVKRNFNSVDTFGGRLAAKFNINDNWSIEPQVVAQDARIRGVFGYNPQVGDLQVQRFAPDSDHDRWYQAGLTINGKIGRYDLTYAGGYFARSEDALSDYTDYSVAYDQYYGSGAYWDDKNGAPLANPQQEIVGRDRFSKGSNELRIASPSTDRFRFIAGLFQERQTHWIIQDYQIQGFGPQISVTGWPNTIWLTDQDRVDSDRAAFGEASFDIIPNKLTITGGARWYHYDNSLYGFYGYGAGYSSHTGEARCPLFPGETFRNAPCVNLNKASIGSGETHKVNLTYHIDDDKLVYFTYSTGYRPGGVNRSGDFGPYGADFLDNYEVGWKTSWLNHSLIFNGALYDEEWSNFQFAFLGPNSLTIIENAPSARILGVESSLQWRATEHLTLSAAGSYNDAKLTQDFCTSNGVLVSPCGSNPVLAPNGEPLPYTPKFNGNATARYTFPVGEWMAHAQASVVYQSSRSPAIFTSDIANLGTSMPGFATADFSFGIEKDKTSAELFIKNAFDSHGQLNRFTPCTTSVCAPGYPGGVGSNGVAYPATPPAVYVVPTQPLTIGIRLGQKF